MCETTSVEKSIMAPRVRTARKAAVAPVETTPPEKGTELTATDAEKGIAKLKADIEANSEYVGMEFAARARDMHIGDTPEQPIYGETSVEEAKQLIEDGVPVAPLPFIPTRKTN